MSYIEDEPRRVPRPVPFSESSPLQPTVPEVSLLLQDSIVSPKTAPSNSFTGTEFQTYNAWRWKNVNEREKENVTARSFSHTKKQDFYPINDKFSGSDIERRKNEILYGSTEEPRRPLPPRSDPIIPKCVGASFSDVSFSSESWNNADTVNTKYAKNMQKYGLKNNFEDSNVEIKKSVRSSIYEEQKDIKDLYQIIADQNKQMVFLQKQIEQLLKSQESKEKHIEQLLKSQETKESKIEQLLKMQDLKENHIEQLLKAQEKHEKQIEQMITGQQVREKQNIELSKKLKSLDKEFVTVGTMTTINLDEKSTNTSFHCSCKTVNERTSEKTQSSEECNRFETGDKSFTLHSLDFPVVQEHTPTPQSSIHVDIPEYNSSSDEDSDVSSSTSKEVQVHNMFDSKSLGYTFYNNVLTQVNDIIHNHEEKESDEAVNMKANGANMEFEKDKRSNYFGEYNVKMAHALGRDKVEKHWGIDMYEPQTYFQSGSKTFENNNHKNGTNLAFQMRCNDMKDTQSPSDISLRMNALALKYLKQEQISQYQMQFETQQSNKQPDVTIYNVTNLSFGTMRYLERYRISSHDVHQSNEGIHPHQFLQQKAKAAMRNCNYMNM